MGKYVVRNKLISVVVCTYKRPELLEKSLSSLKCQELFDGEYEVLIVDNDPTKSAQSVVTPFLASDSRFHYFNETNLGLSHARNRGIKEAKGDFIAFVDDDALVCATWCRRIFHAFQSVKPMPSAVGGPIYPWVDRDTPGWFSEELEIRTWGKKSGFLQGARAKVGFSGSNMAFPKRTLESIGGFDPSFGLKGAVLCMGEDTELFSRLYSQSHNFWYDPEIIVKHYVSDEALSINSRILRWYQNGVCRGRLEREGRSNRPWIRALFHFIKLPVFFLALGPLRICVRSHKRTEVVKVFQDLAFLAGQALGFWGR